MIYTLTHAKPLFSGDKLVSSKRVFALGFFSPASSNTILYLGIWHNQIPDRRFVWVANRDNPITTPSSAMLAITDSSDLRLSGPQSITSWTAKINITSGGGGVVAVLLDTGNFVPHFANGTYIWQSFDRPTDTILSTMKFLVSHKGQVVGRLNAWKGPNDPSSGNFSYSGAPASPDLQMLIRHGTRPYYRGVWNGRTVSV
nr:S-locus-specific glycoprotein S13-like [Aegilops tauschii subsp. strangulata]